MGMTKIIRKRNFLKQFQNLIMGTLWFIVGTFYLLVTESNDFELLSLLYLFLGMFYFVLSFIQKERNQEFIAWDEEQLILSKWQLKPVKYSLVEINQITLTNNHLILTSTSRSLGETMELSGYSETDLRLLRNRFSPERVVSA